MTKTSSPKIEKRKLNKAADFIEALSAKKFDIQEMGHEGPHCGFVGCALGHIASANVFRGFGLQIDKWLTKHADDHLGASDKDRGSTHFTVVLTLPEKTPTGRSKKLEGFKAAQRLFGLTDPQSEFLFGSDWSENDAKGRKATPKRVAERIRKFIADPSIAGTPEPEYA